MPNAPELGRNLDIKQLQFLIALEREQHFGRAAEACHVSQPTLSARIRQLEQELGVLLVERHSHTYHGLTSEGERALGWARKIVADCDAMRQNLSVMQDQLTGSLSLGVVPSALPMVSAITARFRERYPAVHVNVLSRSSKEIQRGLDDFDLEAGISYIDNEPLRNVRHVPLYDERYVVVTNNDANVGSGDGTISWADAAALPLCLLTPDMQNRRILDGAFKTAGASAVPEIETNSMVNLFSNVQRGRLATILPDHFLRLVGARDAVKSLRLIDPDVTHKMGLLIADRDPPLPVAEGLFQLAANLDLSNGLLA